MSFYMNADEVFQIGVRIEENGKAFYEAAAVRADRPELKKLCESLATWESSHIGAFEALRKALPPEAREGQAFDPDSEEGAYVRDAAAGHVFLQNLDVEGLLGRCRTAVDVIDLALSFEKDSIVFYTAMKKVVDVSQGRDKLDHLIEEEVKHVAMLGKMKSQLA
jgi:rubrerythrin